jgi:hypothetical protein
MKYYIRDGLVLGSISESNGRFRYFPYTSARQPSRKAWLTPEDALRGRVRGGRLIEAVNVREALAVAKRKA